MNNDVLSMNPDMLSSDFLTSDHYVIARDEYLDRTFLNKQNFMFGSFVLTFSVGSTAKNGGLVYRVLENLPKRMQDVVKNDVIITTQSEEDLLDNIETISDVINIVKTWKTTKLYINSVQISISEGLWYVIDYLCEKNKREKAYLHHDVKSIRKKYTTRKRSVIEEEPEQLVSISIEDVVASLESVIELYVKIYGGDKEVNYYRLSQFDRVVLIENSLVVDFRIVSDVENENISNYGYAYIYIQELSHNEFFKFNLAGFKRKIKSNRIGIDYYAYHGMHYYREDIDNFDVVDRKLPELKLQERYASYSGEIHHFVILRMENIDGESVYGIGETKGKIHTFILKICKELEEKNSRSLEQNGVSCLSFNENRDFVDAFLSWAGKKKRWRLENKFSYYYVDRGIKDDIELFQVPREILDAAKSGAYDMNEFGTYNKPVNRWKSEELVYNIVKKIYKDHHVIYQYRPFFLGTKNGTMSYDVYICGLKIAVEYQGKQHYEPVDYFGGRDSFEQQRIRDEQKLIKSRENGVELVYINYWEDITPELVRSKVEAAIENRVN